MDRIWVFNAWRAFKFPLDLGVGKHRAVCRAQDGLGDWQPRERKENERGYGHNGWKDHGLSINVVSLLPVTPVAAASATVKTNETAKATPVSDKPISLSATAQRGRELFLTKAQPGCGVCHTLNDAGAQGAVGPNLNQLQPSLSSVRQSVSQGVGHNARVWRPAETVRSWMRWQPMYLKPLAELTRLLWGC